jgi:hypothetical protein
MVSSQIIFVVIGHHARREQAQRLASGLNARLFMDEVGIGATEAHRRAIEWVSLQSKRVVILEDDALPVSGFVGLVNEWISKLPNDLISFYLGTGRPPQYQVMIAKNLINADRVCADFIMLPRLIHGVCYSIPTRSVNDVLKRWNSSKAADYAISDAYNNYVIYPCNSLVDHADGESIEKHIDGSPRNERRRAWRLHHG